MSSRKSPKRFSYASENPQAIFEPPKAAASLVDPKVLLYAGTGVVIVIIVDLIVRMATSRGRIVIGSPI